MPEILASILVVVGTLAFLAGLGWFIVAAVKKTAKRIAAFVLVGGLVASIIGSAMIPPPENESGDGPGTELAAATPPSAKIN